MSPIEESPLLANSESTGDVAAGSPSEKVAMATEVGENGEERSSTRDNSTNTKQTPCGLPFNHYLFTSQSRLRLGSLPKTPDVSLVRPQTPLDRPVI